MKITPHLLNDAMKDIQAALWQAQVEDAREAGEKIAHGLERQLKRTFQYWNQSGQNKYDYPSVRTTVDVTGAQQPGGNLGLRVHVVVVDKKNLPHYLWHLLDRGRGAYTFPQGKKSPPIKARKRRRTFANTLAVDPFPGFTGETFVIHGGMTVKAVPPNDWYEAAAQEIYRIIRSDRQLRAYRFRHTVTQMD